MVTSSNQYHMTFVKLLWLLIGWFSFNSSMARTKVMPRKGEEGKTRKVKTQAGVHAAPVEPPVPAEP